MADPIVIDGISLTVEKLVDIARRKRPIEISGSAIDSMARSWAAVEDILKRECPVYGINTGFGDLAKVRIGAGELERLQVNLIHSHCTGVGELLDVDETRGMMALRINALARGYSGIRPGTVGTLADLLNRDIIPLIPRKGSLGASGDLVPLAHMAYALEGGGDCVHRGTLSTVKKAMGSEGLTPVTFGAKEGIALINGTQFMCSLGALSCFDADNIYKNALIVGAMAIEALLATDAFLDEKVHRLRPHPGQIRAAAGIMRLVKGSEIIHSHRECEAVQDAYTLRCMPQILGASGDVIDHVRKIVEREMNSVTDNPLIFPDTGKVISQGNFHGQPLAMAFDYFGIGVAEMGDWCERLTFRMLTSHLSGLPAFLVETGGLNSGMMLAQYTSAALVAENRILCHPASVDNITTSAGQEDHVSMGGNAANKLRSIIENCIYITALGMLTAAQALHFREEYEPGAGTEAALKKVRKSIDVLREDRFLKDDIEIMASMIRSGEIVRAAEEAVGPISMDPDSLCNDVMKNGR